MTRLHDDMLETVAFLYPSYQDAERGRAAGGTAFVFRIQSDVIDGYFDYLVTNRHNIERGNTTVRISTAAGGSFIADTEEPHWRLSNSDDLAIVRISPAPNHLSYKVLGSDHLLDEATVLRQNIGVGDRVYVAGRLPGADGEATNLPVYRFGQIAANGTRVIDGQESILVEARSLGGLSGAPVFVGIDPLYLRPNVNVPVEGRSWLLGVQWGYVKDQASAVPVGGTRVAPTTLEANSGVMCVVPAWRLAALLHSKPVVDERIQAEMMGVWGELSLRR